MTAISWPAVGAGDDREQICQDRGFRLRAGRRGLPHRPQVTVTALPRRIRNTSSAGDDGTRARSWTAAVWRGIPTACSEGMIIAAGLWAPQRVILCGTEYPGRGRIRPGIRAARERASWARTYSARSGRRHEVWRRRAFVAARRRLIASIEGHGVCPAQAPLRGGKRPFASPPAFQQRGDPGAHTIVLRMGAHALPEDGHPSASGTKNIRLTGTWPIPASSMCPFGATLRQIVGKSAAA